MMHLITRLFNTYGFIYNCCSEKIMPAARPPLNQLVAAFDSHFKSLRVSRICQHLRKGR